ncbi:hypothetical protein ACOMHN_016822 [Nucella lapillus]
MGEICYRHDILPRCSFRFGRLITTGFDGLIPVSVGMERRSGQRATEEGKKDDKQPCGPKLQTSTSKAAAAVIIGWLLYLALPLNRPDFCLQTFPLTAFKGHVKVFRVFYRWSAIEPEIGQDPENLSSF